MPARRTPRIEATPRRTRAGVLRVGTSGWQYAHWRDVYYEGEASAGWFQRYSEDFDCVEVDNTFYGLPQPATFDAWREQAPPGFVFALKFSRFGSHRKKLRDPDQTIALFLARAEHLEAHLGPILVQLPARWRADPGRLDEFLAVAPKRLRWAVEFRDDSWLVKEVYAVLERHGAALCLHDKLPAHPQRLTADWTYLRFHGRTPTGAYGTRRLAPHVERVRDWLREGIDVHAYFNNDVAGHAPVDAKAFRAAVLREEPPALSAPSPAPVRVRVSKRSRAARGARTRPERRPTW